MTPKFAKKTFVNFYLIDCNSQGIELLGKNNKQRMKIYGDIKLLNNESHFAHNETHVMNTI